MRRETTSEWIEQQVTNILYSYPKQEVDRAMPLILLLMARDFGYENLEPRIQRGVLRVFRDIGLHDQMSDGEVQAKSAIYISNLHINEAILRDIKNVFDTHYAALGEGSAANFRQAFYSKANRTAPKVGDRRPKNTLGGEELLRRATGMIRS